MAAGASLRLGSPKQLLPWGKKNVVGQCIETALLAGLDPVIVVLGANAAEITKTIDEDRVRIQINKQWVEGQSTSIIKGIDALPEEVLGAVFLLVDQPQISVNLVRAVMEEAIKKKNVILPIIADRKANPVFFPKEAFDALRQLKGEMGGRTVFSQFPISYVTWLDDDMAEDIDTIEDYRRLYHKHFGENHPYKV